MACHSSVAFVLSIVSSTVLDNAKDLCTLLSVSKSVQAAITSRGSNRGKAVMRCPGGNVDRAARFAHWLQKYHMLVKHVSYNSYLISTDDLAHAHAMVLSKGLRPPLRLASLHMSNCSSLKVLPYVDPQDLTVLRLWSLRVRVHADPGDDDDDGPQALCKELVRFSKLQALDLEILMGRPDLADERACSTLSQLTALTQLKTTNIFPAGWQQHITSQLQCLKCDFLEDAALSNIHHLVQLRELDVGVSGISGAALGAAASCMPQLQVLRLRAGDGEDQTSRPLQALRAIPALQQLEVDELPSITKQDIASIAQASSLTSLTLRFAVGEYIVLDLSPLTALQRLQELIMDCNDETDVSLATLGDSLTHLSSLRALSLGVALKQKALAQVLSLTQLTKLDLDWRFEDIGKAMKYVPGEFMLSMIAFTMNKLRVLGIQACFGQQDNLVAIFNGPWLPELRQVTFHMRLPYLELEELETDLNHGRYMARLVTAVEQARPDLSVSWDD